MSQRKSCAAVISMALRCRRISKTSSQTVSTAIGPASAERPHKVTPMNWIYWNTFWSLFVSLIWFMTIVSHPDSVVVDRHPPRLDKRRRPAAGDR